MSAFCRGFAWFLAFAMAIGASVVGIASVLKYRGQQSRYDEIASYDTNATCRVTSTRFVSNDGGCMIARYDITLIVPNPINSTTTNNKTALPGYFAYSNFFEDECGGVLFASNASSTNRTLMCWYKDLSDDRVRLVSTKSFLPSKLFLYIGVGLTIAGIAPTSIVALMGVGYLFMYIARRCHGIEDPRGRRGGLIAQRGLVTISTSNATGNGNALAEIDHPPVLTEISPTADPAWYGRLICNSEYATTCVRKFEDPRSVRTEECPLCFRRFGPSVVWWTCGHCVCAACIPKVLDAERTQGHKDSPRCPQCRERSDVNDIVIVNLSGTSSPITTNYEADEVELDAIEVGAVGASGFLDQQHAV